MISLVVYYLFEIYSYLIIAYCLVSFLPYSWAYKPAVVALSRIITAAVRPAFAALHALIPQRFLVVGMFDLSPFLLIIGVEFFGQLIFRLLRSYGL